MLKDKKLQIIIKTFLVNHPELRDDDLRLYANVILVFCKHTDRDMEKLLAIDFLRFLANGELPHFESVRRTRQKLQEINPALRGTKYWDRHAAQLGVVAQLNEIERGV